MRISVLVPSRGRPGSIRRLSEAFKSTCEDETTFHIIVDGDDPALEEYVSVANEDIYDPSFLWVIPKGPPGIVHPVNYVSNTIFDPDLGFVPEIIGFMGDDHLPRTKGWDSRVSEAMRELQTGIVYGNDLLQGERLPTAAFLSGNIVQTLGFLAPPILKHLWVDNFWLDLGKGIDRIKYLPEVIIEHLHFSVAKSDPDETYDVVNGSEIANADRVAYIRYQVLELRRAINQVKALL